MSINYFTCLSLGDLFMGLLEGKERQDWVDCSCMLETLLSFKFLLASG
jgi:hypothetical protein